MRRVAWACLAGVMCMPSLAQAAGYWVSEIGPKAIGRGGAFVANPDDPTAMWINPAGLSNVQGMQVYVDASVVRLNQTFSRRCLPTCAPSPYQLRYDDVSATVARHPQDTGNTPLDGFAELPSGTPVALGRRGDSVGTVTNNNSVLPNPNRGINQYGRLVPFLSMAMNGELIGVPGLGLGLAVYGPNTGAVDYPVDGPQRYSVISSEPVEAIVQATVAYRFNRYFGLGAGLALERLGTKQRLALSTDKEGRESPDQDVLVEFNVKEDFIPALIVGFTSNPIAGLHIGGSFITPRQARATGPMAVTPANPDRINADDNPSNLLLSFDDRNARARLLLSSPAAARLGVMYAFKPYFDVEVAVVREFWSQFRYVRLDVEGLNATSGLLPPGSNGIQLPPTVQPKEWRDTWSLRAGGDFHAVPGIFTARAGVFAEESAIPDRTLDLSAADGRKVGVSAGFSLGYFGLRLTGAWQHIFVESRLVEESLAVSNNPVTGTLPGAGGQTLVALGRYDQSYDLLSVGIMVDVGEMALRVKGAVNGDKGWWRPEGAKDRTLVNLPGLMQRSSNL